MVSDLNRDRLESRSCRYYQPFRSDRHFRDWRGNVYQRISCASAENDYTEMLMKTEHETPSSGKGNIDCSISTSFGGLEGEGIVAQSHWKI
ncbi:MAG: hypothetical protein PUP93_18535 [Rhizonema sp. NSF051]|nr:hypothetical protein [Rhizonema sp. NSF051]